MTLDQYARARAAYLQHGTLESVRTAASVGLDVAKRLVAIGEPAHQLPSLQDAARVAAAALDRTAGKAETASAVEQGKQLARTLEARATAARAAREHEGKVLGDATKSRQDEVQLVRANRQSALVLARVNADLLQLGVKVGASLLADQASLVKLPPRERLAILRTIAGIVQRTADASRLSVNMERLLMGEPTAILGREGGGPSTADMTPEEAEQWLSLANRAFARRAARGSVIDVVPVGAGEGTHTEDEGDLYEELAG